LRADALDLLSQVQPARVAAYDLSAQARELLDLAGAQAIQRRLACRLCPGRISGLLKDGINYS